MKAKIFILLSILIACSIGVWWDMHSAPPVIARTKTATTTALPVPDITLQTLEGRAVRLLDYQGKFVLLNFWATWCAPCLKEFPAMLRLVEQYPESLVVLAVSVDTDATAIPRFLRQFEATSPNALKSHNLIIAHDPNRAIAQDVFHTVKLPETYVIAPDQRIIHKLIGAGDDWENGVLERMIAVNQGNPHYSK